MLVCLNPSYIILVGINPSYYHVNLIYFFFYVVEHTILFAYLQSIPYICIIIIKTKTS